MARRPALLALTAALFFGWLAYLAYLALTSSNPIVLSRSQLLAADVVVTAEVEGWDGRVTVREVHRAAAPERAPAKDQTIVIHNLEDCQGEWRGPGRYILPLSAAPDGTGFLVTPVPRGPGYGGGAPRFYPATRQTEGQVK